MEKKEEPVAEEPVKLSEAQKKKLKKKQKEAEAKAKAEAEGAGGAAAQEQTADAGAGKGKKGKKGKPNAAAALILEKKRLQMEAQAELDAENAKIEAEEKRKREEKEEAERKKKEEHDAKIKAEKDRIQALKDAGKWLSKKQLKAKREQEARRAELIAQGVIKPEDTGDETEQKTSMFKRDRNKKKKPQQQQQEEKEEEKETEKVEEQEEQIDSKAKVEKKEAVKNQDKKEESEDDAVDDWENADFDEIADKMKDTKEIEAAVKDEQEDVIVEQKTAKAAGNQNAGNQKKAQKAGGKKQGETDAVDIFAGKDDAMSKEERMRLRKEENLRRLKERNAKKANTKMRCPIVCILGHVDTGKTLILDKLRRTNVQAGEAGGITQQIGATYFPKEYIEGHIEKVNNRIDIDLKLPGFLVIDTPGHESFTNLRSRGSSLCDIAILVVDLMHGLEQQTLESMELLRQKKCPFIIALNKIDRIYEWKSVEYNNVRDSLESQQSHSINEFNERLNKAIVAFAEEGFNACLYWENENTSEFVSFCPTSAITGEGLPDLMTYLALQCQTRIPQQLYEKDEFECTVLEVKVIEGLGTTIDVVLVNGLLKVGDTVVLQGFNGAIVTQIRALLTPQPMKEMRVKAEYVHHQKIKGAMGIKISAPGLENAIAGSELLKATNEHEIQAAKAEIEDNLIDILDKYVDKSQEGVCVQASTLGSLEALLEFLKTSKIPVVSISIGPVHKKDVMKAMKVIAEKDSKRAIKKEFATILAFDVRVTPEAAQFAEKEGIKIFTANIIYHLFDEFTAYVKDCQDQRKESGGTAAIFPCVIEPIKDAVFNRADPILLGVTVKAGVLRVGTPMCVPLKDNLRIGVVESIEKDKKAVTKATPADGSVSCRIGGQKNISFGRHFDDTHQICSWITRKSIDALKEYFRDEMTMDDWKLVKQLKAKYKIE